MKEIINEFISSLKNELLSFAGDIIKIPSYTGHEENVVRRIAREMKHLGYNKVIIDKVGSVIGVIGNGSTKILFDSHIDTVEVKNPEEWTVDPFGGVIKDGKLYGRGASDMKSSAAASVYAGYAMKKLGLTKGKTIYVCCSAIEEDFDGEGLYHAIVDNDLSPDYVVICEPTHLQISLGQRGRSLYKITTEGVSAHGSAPEKGDNAVYKMAAILQRIEALGNKFIAMEGEKGSIAVSKIESTSVSLNAIPSSCSIYIDRRMTLKETEDVISKEMDELVAGTNAVWSVYEANGTSWQGEPILMRSFLPAWEIKMDHPLTESFVKAYRELWQKEPIMYKWDFSTNGVASAGRLGIPTIGFGAGIEKLSHMTNEYCPVSDIIGACEFYTALSKYL
jgi:putative selenium metabolism hydrolase